MLMNSERRVVFVGVVLTYLAVKIFGSDAAALGAAASGYITVWLLLIFEVRARVRSRRGHEGS